MSYTESLIAELGMLSHTLCALTRLTQQESELLARAEVEDLREVLRRKAELIGLAGIQRESACAVAAATLGVILTEHARLAGLIEEVAMSLHRAHEQDAHDMLTAEWQTIVCTIDELGHAQARSERFARQGMTWIEGCLEHLTQPQATHTNTTYTRQGKARAKTSSFLKRQA